MVIKPLSLSVDGRNNAKNSGVPVRQKRISITFDSGVKKRRKFESSGGPHSPSAQLSGHAKQIRSGVTTFTVPGAALFLGVGDTGQLGLGPDVTERSRPALPSATSLNALQTTKEHSLSHFTQICCGGMHSVCLTVDGNVATCGCNDEGALGRPTATESGSSDLSADGCNGSYPIVDECHLGLISFPTKVKVIMVSAGDSHTAALDTNGHIWLWGTFRGAGGPIGLTQPGEVCTTPRPLLAYAANSSAENNDGVSSNDFKSSSRSTNTALLTPSMQVVKIASGQDHLVCLTDEGRLYTMGCGEQGQLGRVAERFAKDGGRSGISSLLQPTECRVRGAVRFSDVWAGGFATFARCQTTGAIYACGLNNYGQLSLRDTTGHGKSLSSNTTEEFMDVEVNMAEDAAKLVTDRQEADRSEAQLIARQGPLIQFMLTRAFGFDPDRNWRQFAIGMHHTLALDTLGHVYAVGRPDYGRLGLGCDLNGSKISVNTPTRVLGALSECVCSWIGCGEVCSFAVDTKGHAYAWGMGSNHQLGHGDSEDDCWEPELMVGKQLEDRHVLMIDAGGQHTMMLACSASQSDVISDDVDILMRDSNQLPNGMNKSPSSIKHDEEMSEVMSDPLSNSNSEQQRQHNVELAKSHKMSHSAGNTSVEPILIPPIGPGAPQSKRNRRASPSSVAGSTGTTLLTPIGFGCESTTGSTAGATINSSVHSSAVSDTCSVGSCASTSSTSSQLNSAKSTDGGGSSRCSSFDNYSVQSSLLLLPSTEDKSCKGT
ncbi:Regulator of chromosome condensation [Schistosoma japonicum]|uniref:Regulator of chromosome condensation n=2 Tax=Schistosoma japonicum TaxID=6182 RepID=A0A4Z2DVS5_SCHJA|nr:Regulator of chromosome condensation [Schistosoma japonicum]KAH8866964.1 Regulator of chromosome condensation [Schistosoma japonicum]TNN20300.1 Regulator of chromosome condensation [Schistosoma japonicum]